MAVIATIALAGAVAVAGRPSRFTAVAAAVAAAMATTVTIAWYLGRRRTAAPASEGTSSRLAQVEQRLTAIEQRIAAATEQSDAGDLDRRPTAVSQAAGERAEPGQPPVLTFSRGREGVGAMYYGFAADLASLTARVDAIEQQQPSASDPGARRE